MSAATSVDLPAPGGPGDADEVGAARPAGRGGAARLGDGRAVLDGGQQPRERPPVAGAGGIGEGGGALRPASRRPRSVARASRWRGGSRRPRGSSCPGPKTPATPASCSGGTSSSGMIPPTVTRTSSRPRSAELGADPRHQRHVGARTGSTGRPRRRPPGAPPSRSSRASGGGRCRRPRSPRRAGRGRAPWRPRSWPSRPGLAMSTLSGRSVMAPIVAPRTVATAGDPTARPMRGAPRRRARPEVGEELGARLVVAPEQPEDRGRGHHRARLADARASPRTGGSPRAPRRRPSGARRSIRKSATCWVIRSWTWSRRAYISTTRGILDSPMTRPSGM